MDNIVHGYMCMFVYTYLLYHNNIFYALGSDEADNVERSKSHNLFFCFVIIIWYGKPIDI